MGYSDILLDIHTIGVLFFGTRKNNIFFHSCISPLQEK